MIESSAAAAVHLTQDMLTVYLPVIIPFGVYFNQDDKLHEIIHLKRYVLYFGHTF